MGSQQQTPTMSPRAALERLGKWRSVFAGWQLGTRAKGDPTCDAARDHREATIMLRAELSALTGLLIEKKVFSGHEFMLALGLEAERLNADYEARFPGMTATASGITYDQRAVATMKGWHR